MSRWNICKDGKSIEWVSRDNIPHTDDVEMSGGLVSIIIAYGQNENHALQLERNVAFPTLRKRPNDTHATWLISGAKAPSFKIKDKPIVETFVRAHFDGVLEVESLFEGIQISRRFYPSAREKAFYETISFTNSGGGAEIVCDGGLRGVIGKMRGGYGDHVLEVSCDKKSAFLKNGETEVFNIRYSGRNIAESVCGESAEAALLDRRKRISELTAVGVLDTGDAVIDTMFHLAKIRAGESVFKTKAGWLHSPGGRNFYGAVWTNDQIEYAAPWFGLTGDRTLIEATMNACKLYIPFMNDWREPIPSSIIAEGIDFWNGAGDRGDAAMYLYGAARFLLTTGNKKLTDRLWNALVWCAGYTAGKINAEGVVESDCDELETRFSAGKANLSTSCIAYGGFRYFSFIADERGENGLAKKYRAAAGKLAASIDQYFGAELKEYHTYRYHEGLDNLRAWICLPVFMGIAGNRAGDTLKAVFSPSLYARGGLRTDERADDFWDRSLLYALAAAFKGGNPDSAFEKLSEYSENRLLGERTPYPTKAYPENGMRHLSAESSLYLRIITEGIFNIEPLSHNSFSIQANLPQAVKKVSFKNLKICGKTVGIYIKDGAVEVKTRKKVFRGSAGEKIIID